jgi:cobalamin biosynthesis protein CobT
MTDATDFAPDGPSDPSDTEEAVEQVVEEVRDDIRHGQVDEDVTHVLEERLEEAGVSLRPEKVDDLAEEIENDVSI